MERLVHMNSVLSTRFNILDLQGDEGERERDGKGRERGNEVCYMRIGGV